LVQSQPILVTGGAGFIGSNFVLQWLAAEAAPVVNLDKLTYAGNPRNLERISDDRRYRFVHGDICDEKLVAGLFRENHIDTVLHFAAESHVDRSILGPAPFIQTNVLGTFTLLEAARAHWNGLDAAGKAVDDQQKVVDTAETEIKKLCEANVGPCLELAKVLAKFPPPPAKTEKFVVLSHNHLKTYQNQPLMSSEISILA